MKRRCVCFETLEGTQEDFDAVLCVETSPLLYKHLQGGTIVSCCLSVKRRALYLISKRGAAGWAIIPVCVTVERRSLCFVTNSVITGGSIKPCCVSEIRHAPCFVINMSGECWKTLMPCCLSAKRRAPLFILNRTAITGETIITSCVCGNGTYPSFCKKQNEYRKIYNALLALCCETCPSFCYK